MRFCLSCPVHQTLGQSTSERMTVSFQSLTLPLLRDQKMDQHDKYLQSVLPLLCPAGLRPCCCCVPLLTLPSVKEPTLSGWRHGVGGLGALFRCHLKKCASWVHPGSNTGTHTQTTSKTVIGTSEPSKHAVWSTSLCLITVLCPLREAAGMSIQMALPGLQTLF